MIQQFRNIKACDLSLSPGFNFLVGANGSGKTSVLEAIYLLGHGRSFKSNLTGRIIQYGCNELVVHGRLLSDQKIALAVGINKQRDGSTEVKIGGQSGQKLSHLAQVLPLQLIHPEGFELLTQGPKLRRAFIDWGVFHSEPAFFEVWNRFRRLNKQRNALLRTAQSYQELGYWDQELAQLADKIDQWRQSYVEQLIIHAQSLCQDFLPEFELTFSYSRGWDKNSDYRQILKENFERDQQLGYTVVGPNKADLKIKANAIPVQDILSRGQLKLMVCALRVAQGQHLTQLTGKSCIYLMDDFASELDSQHRKRLAERLIKTKAQVFVSSITSSQVTDMIAANSRMFHVEHGTIEQG